MLVFPFYRSPTWADWWRFSGPWRCQSSSNNTRWRPITFILVKPQFLDHSPPALFKAWQWTIYWNKVCWSRETSVTCRTERHRQKKIAALISGTWNREQLHTCRWRCRNNRFWPSFLSSRSSAAPSFLSMTTRVMPRSGSLTLARPQRYQRARRWTMISPGKKATGRMATCGDWTTSYTH